VKGPREIAGAAGAALLVAAALIAGCGGGGDDDLASFKKGYAPVNRDLLALGGEVGTQLKTASKETDATLAQRFGEFAKRMDGLHARVDDLDPPEANLKRQTAALSAAMLKLRDDLRGIATAAQVHDATAARAATRALVKDSPALVGPRRTLAAATGSSVGP
jgi:hypothetical protein